MAGRITDTDATKVRFLPGLHSHSTRESARGFYPHDAGSSPAGNTGD